ncbi:MAG: hypothetical protein PHT62_06410 [Desulfotomaculaceae bacterium]|nr:hypothetical protein [Desulfotomaculaceae bacterium]
MDKKGFKTITAWFWVACLLAVLLVTTLPAATVYAAGEFAGGNGSAQNPYQVATAEQLNNVRNQLNGHFIMTADIDLSGYPNWNPIGPFTGNFDGGWYTIRGLAINKGTVNNVGLFSNINGGGVVKNLRIENANVTGQSHVGILAGTISGSSGTIERCSTSGAVTATQGPAGGLVGSISHHAARVNETYSTAAVTALNNGSAGGLVGTLFSNTWGVSIEDSYATGSVNGGLAGGLIGDMYNLEIRRCYAVGLVTGTTTGGLAGSRLGPGVYESSCYYDLQTTGQEDDQGEYYSHPGTPCDTEAYQIR